MAFMATSDFSHPVAQGGRTAARLCRACGLAILLICGSVAFAQPGQRIVLADRIVAVVNNEVITQRGLDERVNVVIRQLQRNGTRVPSRDVMERQVLERMITDQAQLQFARESGVRVEDAAIDAAIARIAENNKLSVEEFRAALTRDGIPYDRFREDVRAEMLLSRLREREVGHRVQVSESEIDNFLAEHQGGGDEANVEFHLSHILVRVPEQASAAQVEQRVRRAQEALKRARAGEDFAQLAVTYSDAQDGLKGGDMGWRGPDKLPELFVRAVAKVRPGEVSDIVRSPAGFHILKVHQRRGGDRTESVSVEQTHARHILVRTNELVSETEARRKLGVLRERIVQGASFEELARLNSDDATAARGGDLGWVLQGDTVPEFQRAMNALQPGEISEPIKSPFGYHLIQVVERRMADVSGDRRRLEARRILRERKAEEAYQEWVRQLRDRAFVEYRLEER